MRMWAQSHLCQRAAAGIIHSRRRFRVNFSDPGGQPVGERVACFRQEVWPSLLGVPRKWPP